MWGSLHSPNNTVPCGTGKTTIKTDCTEKDRWPDGGPCELQHGHALAAGVEIERGYAMVHC